MTFEQAVLTAAEAVRSADVMPILDFWKMVPSVIVQSGNGDYHAITVEQWRASATDDYVVVLFIGTPNDFGG